MPHVTKQTHTFIGIDPGLTGALAAIDAAGRPLGVLKMPTTKQRKSDGGKRTVILAAEVADWLVQWGPEASVCIEDVFASPQMGVTGAFTFGVGRGVLDGVTAALRLPVTWVSPQRWKGAMGVSLPYELGEDKARHRKRLKAASIHKAGQLFPSIGPQITGDGPAEAILLAAYLRLTGGR
jgi:hypothetical protein